MTSATKITNGWGGGGGAYTLVPTDKETGGIKFGADLCSIIPIEIMHDSVQVQKSMNGLMHSRVSVLCTCKCLLLKNRK